MNKVEANIYAARRLANEKRLALLKERLAKRNPERMKRIMPARVMRRIIRGT